jgi:hypothetical protein
MTSLQGMTMTLLTVAILGIAGCTSKTETAGSGSSPSPPIVDAHAGHNHGSHSHPSEGPHHGDLVELGDEEYHAELVHDDQSVTIYILNGAADQQVPIEATEITVNTKQAGNPKQFKLDASPEQDDPAGKSSRFVSHESDLVSHIDEDGADHRLVLTIDGKSYRGEITHAHEGHNH